jgi:predicted ArsR family transcriptional regulator
MARSKVVEPKILEYMQKKKTDVTFKELYVTLKQFSPQGIRNGMTSLAKKGVVSKTRVKDASGKTRVRFKIQSK